MRWCILCSDLASYEVVISNRLAARPVANSKKYASPNVQGEILFQLVYNPSKPCLVRGGYFKEARIARLGKRTYVEHTCVSNHWESLTPSVQGDFLLPQSACFPKICRLLDLTQDYQSHRDDHHRRYQHSEQKDEQSYHFPTLHMPKSPSVYMKPMDSVMPCSKL